jgi:hypothetical protein
MAFVQLIDTDYLFKYTNIDKNIDPTLLNPDIIIAQDTFIQQTLGYNLYTTIMNKLVGYDSVPQTSVITSTSTDDYSILWTNFIQPALAHYSHFVALPNIQYRLTNKGVVVKSDQHVVTTGMKEMTYLRDQVKHYADFYNQRITEQITNFPASYPEYYTTVGLDRIRPKPTQYSLGMWTDARSINIKGKSGYYDSSCCDGYSGIPVN